jgi:hypothetical protein
MISTPWGSRSSALPREEIGTTYSLYHDILLLIPHNIDSIVELEGRKVNLPIKLGVNYQLSSNIPIVIHTTFLFF